MCPFTRSLLGVALLTTSVAAGAQAGGAGATGAKSSGDATLRANSKSTPLSEQRRAATPSGALTPSAPAPDAPVQLYLRSALEPLLFAARAEDSDGTPALCASPCEFKLRPGRYRLRLNDVTVRGAIALSRSGTLDGVLDSRAAGREAAWLALNVGGILGGVFVTVAALGGPSWTYLAGGGAILSGGAIFVLTYRSDRATVSFSPALPVDLRGLVPPLPSDDNSSGPTHGAGIDRPRFGELARGLSFRVTF